MNTLKQTAQFKKWLKSLKDSRAKAKIAQRIQRLKLGNAGDVKPVGGGISELRVDYGPGYRVYYTQEGKVIYLVLNGGTKKTQEGDIREAKKIAKEARKQDDD